MIINLEQTSQALSKEGAITGGRVTILSDGKAHIEIRNRTLSDVRIDFVERHFEIARLLKIYERGLHDAPEFILLLCPQFRFK